MRDKKDVNNWGQGTIRASIARTPEASNFTSLQQRIKALKSNHAGVIPLLAFHRPHTQDDDVTLPFVLHDYLELVDWSGRMVREDKRGVIDEALPPILTRLNIDADIWQQMMQPNGNLFKTAIGRIDT